MKREDKKERKGFGVIIKALIAAVLVTSIIVSTLFGTVGAEFVKSLSKKVDFEAAVDIPWSYRLIDSSGDSVSYYTNYKNIEQKIDRTSTDVIKYQIKVPVSETGLYNLDFTVDFVKDGGDETQDIFTELSSAEGGDLAFSYPVGCKVNTAKSSLDGAVMYLATWNATKTKYNDQPIYGPKVSGTNAEYHDYQWKTLAPSRAENVSLAFNVETVNASDPYVIWEWDLRGLDTGSIYIIKLSNISIAKVDIPEGAYIDFSDTHYVNNALIPTDSGINNQNSALRLWVGSHAADANGKFVATITGAKTPGKTRPSTGRGTFVTEATYNSMTMQAESLVYGYHNGNTVNGLYAKNSGWGNPNRYSNIISFGMPVKGVEKNKTYKVTFDLSVARQGDGEVKDGGNADYADFHDILARQNTSYQIEQGNIHFESYLYTGVENIPIKQSDSSSDVLRKVTDHGRGQVYSISGAISSNFGRGLYKDPSKILIDSYENDGTNAKEGSIVTAYMTRYNELWNVQMGNIVNADYGTVSSVNDYRNRSQEVFNSYDAGYNMFNAVRRTEYNGQNKINWITFTNSTFTFTVPGNLTNNQLRDLHWMWAIDAFADFSWNRIKFENVRVEEVVSYGSNVENNSLVINGENAGFETRDDEGLYRGANGTGQNGGARAYEAEVPFANMNIYAPVYDASGISAKFGNDSTITFSGYAVCKGGVEKYMWSADNGKTWYDMKTSILSNADASTLVSAESHAENSMIGLHIQNANDANGNEVAYTFNGKDYVCERADFNDANGDGRNAYYTITASLEGTPYENSTNLNIIFAAVPTKNQDLRCEIMRVINYNPTKNYLTRTVEVRSDIRVASTGNNAPPLLKAAYKQGMYSAHNNFDFSACYGVSVGTGTTYDAPGTYSLRGDTHSGGYEDVRALFLDFPVKKSMTFYGFAMVEGGVEGYYWSVDYGKTWNACTVSDGSTAKFGGTNPYGTDFNLAELRRDWYDGVAEVPADSNALANNAYVPRSGAGLGVDLSSYQGRIVDVIVAAKPAAGGAYVPLGRVDNVAVYGEYGSSFTKINNLYAKGYDGKTNEGGNLVGDVDTEYTNGVSINNCDKWANLLLSGFTHKTYNIYEPYNVNYTQARFLRDDVVNVYSGQEVIIRGYTGIKLMPNTTAADYTFYYTLDHGETVVNVGSRSAYASGTTDYTDTKKYSQQSNYDCDTVLNYNGGNTDVRVIIPADIANGTVLTLFVYIESPENENGERIRYPVLNMRVKVNKK